MQDRSHEFRLELSSLEKIWQDYNWILIALEKHINLEMKEANKSIYDSIKLREKIQPYFSNKSSVFSLQIKT